jgi:hypothetical protein
MDIIVALVVTLLKMFGVKFAEEPKKKIGRPKSF